MTTRLLGSVVPVPNAGRPLKVVVDGERGEGVTNELGRFAFPVKGRDGDTVRSKIYADGTLLYRRLRNVTGTSYDIITPVIDVFAADACLIGTSLRDRCADRGGRLDMASLNRPAAVLVAGAIVLGWSVTAAILGAAAKSVSGLVRSLTHRSPVTATEVRIDAGHFDTTTDSGSFAIAWSPPLRAGFPVTFSVKGWVVVIRAYFSQGAPTYRILKAEQISIAAVRQGDVAAMSNVVGCIIEQHASQFKGGAARAKASMSATPRRGFRFEHGGTIAADQTRAMRVFRSVRFTLQSPALRASQPVDDGRAPAGDDEVFAEQAAQFGLTPVQLAIAIEAWSAAVEDPYGRGLAALNRQR